MRTRLASQLRAPVLLVLATSFAACAPPAPPTPAGLPSPLAQATQLVVVTTPGWDATAGELRRFARDRADQPWRAVGEIVPVVIGRTGLAWGVDYDALAAGEALGGPGKREGDGRSPAGAFPLDSAFGFAPADSAGWLRLPYLPLAATTECVDDTASVHYNAIVDTRAVPAVDWRSAEHMRRIEQYRLGVTVGYNTRPMNRGRGSCIFLHIWSGPASPTAGCTAMAQPQLAELAAWLDPRTRPVLVQLPAAAYRRLRERWGLPAPQS